MAIETGSPDRRTEGEVVWYESEQLSDGDYQTGTSGGSNVIDIERLQLYCCCRLWRKDTSEPTQIVTRGRSYMRSAIHDDGRRLIRRGCPCLDSFGLDATKPLPFPIPTSNVHVMCLCVCSADSIYLLHQCMQAVVSARTSPLSSE
jgi:hypothetical protein